MSETKTLADKLKAAPSVTDSSGKTVLLTDANGDLSKTTIVAFADKLVSHLLEGEDLNDIMDASFCTYFASTSNTCLNKPNGVSAFYLRVFRNSGNGRIQILTDYNGVEYQRVFSYIWQPWKRMLTESDLTQILNRLTALENK